jgi:serine/threonine-protein kinase
MVLECVPEDLRQAVAIPCPPSVALSLMAQVAERLAAVHAAGIALADLRPESVLVERMPDGRLPLRVCDFGVPHRGGSMPDPDPDPHRHPAASVGYLSPEGVAGHQVGPKGDVYAVGVMLYELISGRRPFVAGNPLTVMLAHIETPPERPPGVTDPVWNLLSRLLSKDPAVRPDAAAASMWLRTLADPNGVGHHLVAAHSGPAPYPPSYPPSYPHRPSAPYPHRPSAPNPHRPSAPNPHRPSAPNPHRPSAPNPHRPSAPNPPEPVRTRPPTVAPSPEPAALATALATALGAGAPAASPTTLSPARSESGGTERVRKRWRSRAAGLRTADQAAGAAESPPERKDPHRARRSLIALTGGLLFVLASSVVVKLFLPVGQSGPQLQPQPRPQGTQAVGVTGPGSGPGPGPGPTTPLPEATPSVSGSLPTSVAPTAGPGIPALRLAQPDQGPPETSDQRASLVVANVRPGAGRVSSIEIGYDDRTKALTPATGAAGLYRTTVTGLQNGHTYLFVARVCNSYGRCAHSNPVRFTPFTVPTLGQLTVSTGLLHATIDYPALILNGNPHPWTCRLSAASTLPDPLASLAPTGVTVSLDGGSLSWVASLLGTYTAQETCTDGATTVQGPALTFST